MSNPVARRLLSFAPALLGVQLLVGVTAAPPAEASLALHATSGCVACHMVDRRLVGPSYKEIAAKYKGRADAVPYLSDRVRKGGPGNWGQVPMAPNDVTKLNNAQLKTLITWILATP
jgi:cytochrome c